jgi:cell division protease FtsH
MGERCGHIIIAAIIFLIILMASGLMLSGCASSGQINISLSQAIDLSKNQNIQSANIDANDGTMTMTAAVTGAPLQITDVNGSPVEVVTGTQLTANIDSLNVADLQQLGFALPASYTTSASSSELGTILLYGLPILFIILIFYVLSRAGRGVQSQIFSFARSRARLFSGKGATVTFADVADSQEAKDDLKEVVEFLKNRGKFQNIGATIPKGVLLVGPPGTGKTLLARAVAGEANVPFFSVSGSEFVEIFVGVGASRVRDLFEQAKRSAPCIVFVDELDAVGRQRAGSVPGSHEEREQTLNQILVEMDGFDQNTGVVVLAATNRVDVLDPALLRPGRFDRRVTIELPDTEGRTAILQIHARGKKLAPGVDLSIVAKETHGFSGADLANLMNEAAILAIRRNKSVIGMDEIEDSIDRVIAGPERKSVRLNPRDKETAAYHESGHALVAHMLPNVDPVHKISIVARGTMGGYTRLLTEDRYFMNASQFKDSLSVLLGGKAAEQLMLGQVSTGPHNDIEQATALARRMITDFGMSEKLGLRTYGRENKPAYLGFGPPEEKDYSEETARRIDQEMERIMGEAQQRAARILQENKPRLVHIADKLLAQETLEGPELETAFAEPLTEKDSKVAESGINHDNAKLAPSLVRNSLVKEK